MLGRLALYSAIALLVLSTVFYFYFQYASERINSLSVQIESIQQAVEEQRQVIAYQTEVFERQTTALNRLSAANQQLQAERDRLARVFSRHDLEELSRARPGLVEGIINRGTQETFDDLMRLTTPE
jgi:methyl-accepting chemotaxis protein